MQMFGLKDGKSTAGHTGTVWKFGSNLLSRLDQVFFKSAVHLRHSALLTHTKTLVKDGGKHHGERQAEQISIFLTSSRK